MSYAWLKTVLQGEKEIKIVAKGIDLVLDESASDGINLVDAMPTYDDSGKENNPYKFTLKNNNNIDLYYTLSLEDDLEALNSCTTTDGSNCQLLDLKDIRYELKIDNKVMVGTLSDSPVIYYGIINSKESLSGELRIWLNIKTTNEAIGKVYLSKLRVFATQQVDESQFSQGTEKVNAPDLDSNMIAVKHDGYNWVKTDVENGWYNYGMGIWANAVTVKADKLSTYQNAGVGSEVLMEDIETMWVWIPRYSYTIGTEDGVN